MNIIKPLVVISLIFLFEICMAVFIFTFFKDTSKKAAETNSSNAGNETACHGENCTNSKEDTCIGENCTNPPTTPLQTTETSETLGSSSLPPSSEPPDVDVCESDQCMKLKAARTIKAKMDLNVDPCEDFYRYSCGGWLDNVQVPDDAFMIGSFSTIDRDSTSKLKDMLSNETRASDPLYEAVPKTFYAACVNTDLIDERGAKPFLDLISTVGGFPVINSLWSESDFNMEDLVIKLHELGLTPFMSLYVNADKGQKKTFILDFPYYVVSDRNESSNREFVMEALRLLGADEDVLNRDFEEMNAVKLAVLQALYNSSATVAYPISIDQLQEKYKWLDWRKVFKTIAARGNIVIESTDTVKLDRDWYFNQLSDLLRSTSKRALANYMMARLLTFTELLDFRFMELNNKYPADQSKKTTSTRWLQCLKTTQEKLPEAVYRMYVDKHFRKEDKDSVMAMIHNITETFHEILDKNTWLSNETKAGAKTKLSAMGFNVGYPESLLDDNKLNAYYSNVFKPGYEKLGFFELSLTMVKSRTLENLKLLAAETEYPEKWPVSASVAHAYHIPTLNSIFILAGILQPPFYYRMGSSSMNYGSIGSGIGHEISHGFDTAGSQYDENGELNDWWTWSDKYIFKYLATCYAHQYSFYNWEGHQVDGYKTLNENLVDHTGLDQSFLAYRRWVTKRGAEEEKLPDLNLTHNQIFFVSFAQLWCSKVKDGFHPFILQYETHAMGNVRVQGPLCNSNYFARTFDCKINSTMNPENKCFMW